MRSLRSALYPVLREDAAETSEDSVTALIGAPVVLWAVLGRRHASSL